MADVLVISRKPMPLWHAEEVGLHEEESFSCKFSVLAYLWLLLGE